MTRIKFVYCVDNILDSLNKDAVEVAKEALQLPIQDISQPSQSAEPPLMRKQSKPMPGISRPSSRQMDEEGKKS